MLIASPARVSSSYCFLKRGVTKKCLNGALEHERIGDTSRFVEKLPGDPPPDGPHAGQRTAPKASDGSVLDRRDPDLAGFGQCPAAFDDLVFIWIEDGFDLSDGFN